MAPTRDFPTTGVIVTNESDLRYPGALMTTSHSGISKTRATNRRGGKWTRTYDGLFSQDPDVRKLLSFIRMVWNRGYTFNIQHQMLPGSGQPPNGSGASGATVDSGTSGTSISTSGWPVSTNNVVRAGDIIRIDTFGAVREVTADANSDGSGNATISINPPISSDEAPSTSEAITTTGVDLWARIASEPNIPSGHENAFYINGLTLELMEVPNA